VGNDGQAGNDAQVGIFHEGGGDQNAIHEIVEGVPHQDHQAGTAVVMGRRPGLVGFAMVGMAMAPKHQFFQNEKQENARQQGQGHHVRAAMFQGVGQNFQEHCPQKGTDGVGNEVLYAGQAQDVGDTAGGHDAQAAPQQGHADNPGQGAHGEARVKKATLYAPPLVRRSRRVGGKSGRALKIPARSGKPCGR